MLTLLSTECSEPKLSRPQGVSDALIMRALETELPVLIYLRSRTPRCKIGERTRRARRRE